jgi:hypothetical protein
LREVARSDSDFERSTNLLIDSFRIARDPGQSAAVSSHSNQGPTAERVLAHVDVEQAGGRLLNRWLAYVALSRGRYDAQVYSNDKAILVSISRVTCRADPQWSRDTQQPAAAKIKSSSVSQAQALAAQAQSIGR